MEIDADGDIVGITDRAVDDGNLDRSDKSIGLNTSFPIKKIAFRPKVIVEDVNEDDSSDDEDDDIRQRERAKASAAEQSFNEHATQKEKEEREELIRKARAAAIEAIERIMQGNIPGQLFRDEKEGVRMTPIAGSVGWELTKKAGGRTKIWEDLEEKKKEEKESKKQKKMEKKSNKKRKGKGKVDDSVDGAEEEKEEITSQDDRGNASIPRTYGSRTAADTEFDNTTTRSGDSKSTKSSFFDPKRMFRNRKKKKKQKNQPELTPDEQALQEAKDLLSNGAWMCGVCGTPFDTEENARDHEKVCFIEWSKHDALVRQGWEDEGHEIDYCPNDVPIMYLKNVKLPPYPEHLYPKSKGEIPLSSPLVRKYLVMTDRARIDVMERSTEILHEKVWSDLCELSLKKQAFEEAEDPSTVEEYTDVDAATHEDLFIWMREYDAMKELEWASRDRHWYAHLERRAYERRHGPQPHLSHHDFYYHRLNRIHAAGSEAFNMGPPPEKDVKESEAEKVEKTTNKVFGKVKGKFEHAYKLAKEGPTSSSESTGNKKHKDDKESSNSNNKDMKHDRNTLFINVVVKSSVQVVNNELQRMAGQWWQSELNKKGEGQADKEEVLDFQFEWIRKHTQKKVIQLARMALASDFTPSKVAVQLSNDLYRLIEPQLRPKGVTIQTVIEYREGQYFVLAVNIVEIDWEKLMKWVAIQFTNQSNQSFALGQSRRQITTGKKKKKKKATLQSKVKEILTDTKQRFPSRNEVISYILYRMDNIHVLIAIPLLRICYFLFLKYAVNKFILNAVTDDIFRYVESKGMEMQLGIKNNNDQAQFMLAALREIRSGSKGQVEDGDEEEQKPILGPFMGPLIKDDNNVAAAPEEFSPPDNLEFTGFETDLPVGFLRLRWALLNIESKFFKDAFLADVLKYDNIEMGEWSEYENDIGLPKPSEGADESLFLNKTLEYSYLMPKSAFVKANTCYATLELTYYDNYCLVIKEKTLTPEVPYGNTFVAWTQYTIINTGKNTCRMICSVEAEFPNGAPIVARQESPR